MADIVATMGATNGATKATMEDIRAFAAALGKLNETQRAEIVDIYAKNGDNLGDTVRIVANYYNQRPATIWALIDDFGRFFATERGLI